MNISTVAKQVGLTPKTLRYYESIGLIAPVKRNDSGYRVYTPEDIDRLQWLSHARKVGFTLDECKVLLKYKHNSARQSAHVKQMVLDKVASLEEQIKLLQETKSGLLSMASRCAGDTSPQCAILDELDQMEP